MSPTKKGTRNIVRPDLVHGIVRYISFGFSHGGKCRVLGGFIHRMKFVLGFRLAYTRKEICIGHWVGLYTE